MQLLTVAAVRTRALLRGYRLATLGSSEDAYRLYARRGNHLVLGGRWGVSLAGVAQYLDEQV